MLKPKISIIGAGSVGIRYAYALMFSGLARSIVILDLDKPHAEGEVLDLSSSMPFVSPVQIIAGDYPDIKDSDLIVITAGRKQKPNQTRLELVQDNVNLFKAIIPEIAKYDKDGVFLIATNPVDILSYAAHKISFKPWSKVIGSGTVLDSARLRLLLSQHCNIDARNIHAYILGEHGDSEFPVWSKAMVGAALLEEQCLNCNKCNHREDLSRIFAETRDFAYKIIERKGETSYGIGMALTRITEAIIKDENSVLPVSCFVQNYYGKTDLYMSLPAVVNKSGIREILDVRLNNKEIEQFKKSADTIKTVIRELSL